MRIGTLRKVIGDGESGLDDSDKLEIRVGSSTMDCSAFRIVEGLAMSGHDTVLEVVADDECAPQSERCNEQSRDTDTRGRFIGAKVEVQMHHNDCSQDLVLRIQRLDTDALEWLLRICEFGEVAIDCSGPGKWLHEHLRSRGLRCVPVKK